MPANTDLCCLHYHNRMCWCCPAGNPRCTSTCSCRTCWCSGRSRTGCRAPRTRSGPRESPVWRRDRKRVGEYSANRVCTCTLTVDGFGLYPVPPGHSVLYSSVSVAGHDSHLGPQALPTEQQHVAFDTADPISWLQRLWPPLSSTSM